MAEPGSTTTTSTAPADEYLKAIAHRRSVYPLNDESPVSEERIIEIVQKVLAVSPSAYNTQPHRVVVILGEKHKKLWQVIRDAALPTLETAGKEVVDMLKGRFDLFQGAYGSITFWDSGNVMKAAQEAHKSAAHMFPSFIEQSSGMLQVQVWTALELEGLGANLQHMGAIASVQDAVKKEFELPGDWTLKAHLNIGGVSTPHPPVPAKLPFAETLKILS